MEFDPLARDVAPPRHEIESDSEDEANAQSQPRKPFTPPEVDVVWHNREEARMGCELIVFQSDGGEAFLRGQLQQYKEVSMVMIDDEQHGSIAMTDDKKRLLMLLRPSIKLLSDQAKLNYISLPILTALKPSKLTIVDDYTPSLYITSKDIVEDPIRYVSTQADILKVAVSPGIELFETPNYVLGLAASMMNESGLPGIPSTVLMLPRAVNPHLQSWSRIQANSSSLDTQPDPLREELTACLTSLLSLTDSSTQESDTPDILDYLQIRRSKARKTMAQNVSAMYV